MSAALSMMVAGKVTTHALKIPLNKRQSTARLVRTNPVAQTDPTWQCVVLMGIPRLEAIRTVVADPSSIAKPLYDGKWRREYPLLICYIFNLQIINGHQMLLFWNTGKVTDDVTFPFVGIVMRRWWKLAGVHSLKLFYHKIYNTIVWPIKHFTVLFYKLWFN